MRVPTTINKNTTKAYEVPKGIFDAKLIRSDNFNEWDKNIPQSLKDLCLQTIAHQWERIQALDELILDYDRWVLLDLLSPDLPLELTVPKINEDHYWERCFRLRWPKHSIPSSLFNNQKEVIPVFYKNVSTQISPIVRSSLNNSKSSTPNSNIRANTRRSIRSNSGESVSNDSSSSDLNHEINWKEFYLEKHLQDLLENLKPECYNPEQIKSLSELCGPYIKTLKLAQLHAPENGTEKIDHIPLNAILTGLPYLTELSICFKQTFVGEKFSWHVLHTSINDIKLLAKGLEKCNLSTLRILNSDVDCTKISMLVKALPNNKNLKVVDFSHCKIGDYGALAICKIILELPHLENVTLTNNKISKKGAQYFASVLCKDACKIQNLDLKLNHIGSEGGKYLTSALIKGSKSLSCLSIAACGLNSDNIAIGNMLVYNNTLKYLELSNNKLGEDVGKEILNGLSHNKIIQYLDVRICGLTPEMEHLIRQKISFNRKCSHRYPFTKDLQEDKPLSELNLPDVPELDLQELKEDAYSLEGLFAQQS